MRFAAAIVAASLTSAGCSPRAGDRAAPATATPPSPGAEEEQAAGAPGSDAAAAPPTALAPRTAPSCPTVAAGADYQVTVTTAAGFVGGRPFAARGTTCMNLCDEDDARRRDYVPRPDPATVTMLAALRPAYLRWVPGHDGQIYRWQPASTLDPAVRASELSRPLVDAFVAMCRAVGAEPFIAINFKTGTAEQAASLVRYLNVEKKYGVKWFQIGNEPDLPADAGLPNPAPLLPEPLDQQADLEVLAARYTQFADAIAAVDPNARLVAPEMMMGQDLFGFKSKNIAWLTPLMRRLGPRINAISWHYYAKWSGQKPPSSQFVDPQRPQNLLQEDAPDWPTAGMNYADLNYPTLRSVRDTYNSAAEIWVTEFAEDPGTKYNGQYLSDRVAGAIWAADLLGRFAEQGTDVNCRFLFKGKPSHYYALVDVDNNPRPPYGTYWLYAQLMGESYVLVEHGNDGDRAKVAAHATLRAEDGSLTVVLANKSGAEVGVALKLTDFTPLEARRYELVGQSLGDTTIALNGKTLSQAMVGEGLGQQSPQPASPCAASVVRLPANSAVFLAFSRL